MILNVSLIIINDCSCNSATSNLSVPDVATDYQVTFYLIFRKKTLTIKPAFLTKAQEQINFEILSETILANLNFFITEYKTFFLGN